MPHVWSELKIEPGDGSYLWHVELRSHARGRKELGAFYMNDDVRGGVVVGFVVSPFEDRAAVVVQTAVNGPPAVFGAHLTKGFAK